MAQKKYKGKRNKALIIGIIISSLILIGGIVFFAFYKQSCENVIFRTNAVGDQEVDWLNSDWIATLPIENNQLTGYGRPRITISSSTSGTCDTQFSDMIGLYKNWKIYNCNIPDNTACDDVIIICKENVEEGFATQQ